METHSALVVGACGGIGRAISTQLAKDGWQILAHGRDDGKLQATKQAVEQVGGVCTTFSADLSDPTGVTQLAEWANTQSGFSAVVWTAGGGKSVDSGPDALEEWQRTLAVILHAPMRLVGLTLPVLKQRQGSYLFIAGMYAKIGMSRMAAHCAGRHGLEGFCKALFEEVREDGVSVTLLHPGFVFSPLSNLERLDPEKMIQTEDIAAMVSLAINMPVQTCVCEMVVRPQRSPYR